VTAAQAPLPAIIEVRRAAVALDVLADHITGLVVIQPRSRPRPAIQVAPEVGLELAQRLVAAIADLTRPPRRL
jgi:hypothetical protein